jgi:RND family efflux transporter MFP subunit
MKKATQRNLLIGLAGLALLLILTTPDRSPELEEPVPARVLVATVLNHDLLPQQSVSGHLAPRRRASLHFELSGQVRERLVEPGQSVAAGEMLLALLEDDYRDALDRAEAQLELERGNIDKDRELLRLARRNHALQSDEVARLEQLGQDSLISQSRLDESRIKLLQLQSEVARLKNSTDTAASRLRLLDAQRSRAARDLQRAGLAAPFAGIVNGVHVEVGDYVTPNQAVAEIIDISSLDLYVEVRGELAEALSQGQPLAVTVGERTVEGVLVALQVDPDPETFTHALRIRIPGDAARSGSVARVRLPLRQLQQAVAVPSTAILQDDGNAYVFRLDSEILRRTPVSTGTHVGELVVITAGLAGGERVVVRDVAALSDGMRVTAVQADRTAGP